MEAEAFDFPFNLLAYPFVLQKTLAGLVLLITGNDLMAARI